MRPGEIIPGSGDIPLNTEMPRKSIPVTNKGDRAVQVGSHYHFAAVNPALDFDRAAAWGYRLDIPAGKAMRFEPKTGGDIDVPLVRIGGTREVPGLRPEFAGALDERGPDPVDHPYGEKGEPPR